MAKMTLLEMSTFVVLVGMLAPSASASCNPPKFVSTYNPATQAFVYWTTSLQPPSGETLVGRIWANGVDYTGTCNSGAQSFFYWGLAPGSVGLSLVLGGECVPPGLCPSNNLNAKAWVTKIDGSAQESWARQVHETPGGGVNFDFSDAAASLVASPRPRMQGSSRVGDNVNVTTSPEAIPGDADSLSTVTGCNILSASSATWPGMFATAYPTLLATVPKSGGSCASTALQVDCSGATDQWIVYQIVTNAGPDAIVGPAAWVRCNQALAEPKTKIIPKKNAVQVRD